MVKKNLLIWRHAFACCEMLHRLTFNFSHQLFLRNDEQAVLQSFFACWHASRRTFLWSGSLKWLNKSFIEITIVRTSLQRINLKVCRSFDQQRQAGFSCLMQSPEVTLVETCTDEQKNICQCFFDLTRCIGQTDSLTFEFYSPHDCGTDAVFVDAGDDH